MDNQKYEPMTSQQVCEEFEHAIKEKQFVAYFQPQYNHSTGMMIGAEALARWIHPERGLISPGIFIPAIEESKQIVELDFYIFEYTCAFIQKCMRDNLHIIPISSNFSRYDIFQDRFVEKLEQIRNRYGVPSKYLRVELTESVAMEREIEVNGIITKLNELGYLVEMDDFGSGFSSLNVLKDISFNIIKIDMKFMSSITQNNRAGIILNSVVRMAQWLGMPIIAEGVETKEQANFLGSIGCDYIQGYLYEKPLPEEILYGMIQDGKLGKFYSEKELIDHLDACTFWTPESLDTLIFSNYVGAAVVFEYNEGKVKITRVNKKYLKELSMNLSEKEVIEGDILDQMDEEDRKKYISTLECAIKSQDEEECETWRNIKSACCGDDRLFIRSSIRMIGKCKKNYLFYAMVRNITAEATRMSSLLKTERQFKVVSEHANIYYWEYTIATKEMRPCFRCIRDLGFPPLVANYPEPVFEWGVFPSDYADMYRDWHKQIANGVKSLEAIIPLTADRVPFFVRYTTEFDETGNPIKAYGSATMVV
ncbi:EAL domain-containing protein [[Clostridium] polysaccharolyticum]|uniref:EAL domain, c-di-GMP-specific phosphodiesterase class I (Or its enzymatically inactive variant) n=1 Tax=[Clostridium] polysaccharolyticum TaxID=29364 RepID=A0A1I0CHZ5_9FIRM|nr:EAL domain-containing protein [[Clostridium] polysaccharolyticum]SET19234.1 EAL domain, c-di-GMP-specific phosphodiesterase class I (or its enzymatically inactive variant) [[Clostridium] polysaccharolyticum]